MERPPTHRQSLERLISPDRSDALPAVSHAPKRLFLFGSFLLLATAAAWLGFGTIDKRVRGGCILVSPQGISEITSNGAGRLEGLGLRAGDQVAAGQVIAHLRRPEFEQDLAKAKARLDELVAGKERVERLVGRSLVLGKGGSASEQTAIAARLATVTARQELAQKRLQAQQKLFAEGLVTRQSLLAAEQQVDGLGQEQAQLNSRASQLAFQLQGEQRKLNSGVRQLDLQISEAGRALALLVAEQDSLMRIRSTFAGRVVEVKTQDGALVSLGSNVATIERNGPEGGGDALVALIFVPAVAGKLLHAGMAAEITPTNVKRQEFGFIRAAISSVSDFPASRESIQQLLQNPGVVKELAGEGAPTQVQAALVRRADGGYAWSGAARVPPQVRSGSVCAAEVVVRERRPVEFIWPFLKKISGMI